MKANGLSNYACEFMASYLSDMYQGVKISNEKTSWMPLLKFILQGSSLGPFVFNIFMNDLFYFIETCSLTNYADDNTLDMNSCTIETVLSALKTDTEKAINLFVENFRQVNPSKFQFMFLQKFTSKEIKPEFMEVHGINIPRKNKVKLL